VPTGRWTTNRALVPQTALDANAEGPLARRRIVACCLSAVWRANPEFSFSSVASHWIAWSDRLIRRGKLLACQRANGIDRVWRVGAPVEWPLAQAMAAITVTRGTASTFTWHSGPTQPLKLIMPTDVDDGYEMYVNGTRLLQFGDFSIAPPRVYLSNQIVAAAIPPSAGQDLTFAIRFWMSAWTSLKPGSGAAAWPEPWCGIPSLTHSIGGCPGATPAANAAALNASPATNSDSAAIPLYRRPRGS